MTKLTTLLTVMVFAFAFFGQSLSGLLTVRAADPVPAMAFGIPFQNKASLGDNVKVPVPYGATVTVKDPRGNVTQEWEGTETELQESYEILKADMVGYYTVNYLLGDGTVFDGMTILIESIDPEWVIPYNGAGIPTYKQAGADATIDLPKAELKVFKNDDTVDKDETAKLAGVAIEVLQIGPDFSSTKLALAGDVYKSGFLASSGAYTFRYRAEIIPGVKTMTKDFVVKVQDKFESKESPVLNVAPMPGEVNLRTKVTLPKATATDNFDENVKIEIKVESPAGTYEMPDGTKITVAAKSAPFFVELDENDKRTLVVDPDASAVFDNGRNMSFYPLIEGQYSVEYIATNDEGKIARTRYTLNASDKQLPTFDLDESLVPLTWGMTVYKKDTTGASKDGYEQVSTATDEGKFISLLKFPAPKAYDNVTAEDKIEHTFTLRNNKSERLFQATVTGNKVKVDTNDSTSTAANGAIRIYGVDADGNIDVSRWWIPTSAGGGEKIFDTENGFNGDGIGCIAFDASLYSGERYGNYSASYTARDEAGNPATRSFNVNLRADYQDKDIPQVTSKNVPEYIFTGDTFTRQSIIAWDDTEQSKVKLEVKYFFNGVEFFTNDAQTERVFEKGEGGVIRIEAIATDKVGQSAIMTPVEIDVIDVDFTSDAYAAPQISYTGAVEKHFAVDDDKVEFTDIVIQNVSAPDKFMGFEAVVRAPGGTIERASVYYTVDTDAGKITINSISFVPTLNADSDNPYRVTIRGFMINGISAFITLTATAEIEDDDDMQIVFGTANTTMPEELQIGEAYALPKATITNGILVTMVEGPRFAVSGTRMITPMLEGDFVVRWLGQKPASVFDINELKAFNAEHFTAIDKSQIKYKLLDEFKNTIDRWTDDDTRAFDALVTAEEKIAFLKDHAVIIPKISVISVSEVTKIKVTVTGKEGEVTVLEFDEDGFAFEYFKPISHGQYTIVIEAFSSSNVASETFRLTITAGNLVPPTLTVKDEPSKDPYKINSDFYFSEVTVSSVMDKDTNGVPVVNSSKITVYKALYGPDKGFIDSDTSADNSEKKVTLTQTGIYRVVYEATDEAGNKTTLEYTFTVQSNPKKITNTAVLATVLIVTAVLLFISMFVYFFVFKKTKE